MKNIYLDIDGVLNAVTHEDAPHGHDWDSEWSKKKVNGFWILYNKEMIKALNELAKRDDVEVIWLTTWRDLACSMMSDAIGIDGKNWRFLDTDDSELENFSNWWKLDAIKKDIAKTHPRKVVWIDDDIKYEKNASEWVVSHYSVDFNILAISPYVGTALSKAELDEIVEFLDEG